MCVRVGRVPVVLRRVVRAVRLLDRVAVRVALDALALLLEPAQLLRELAERAARDVIRGLAGRAPPSVAAAAVFAACHLLGEGRSARQVGGVAGISETTLRTAYRCIWRGRAAAIDRKWLGEGKGKGLLLERLGK